MDDYNTIFTRNTSVEKVENRSWYQLIKTNKKYILPFDGVSVMSILYEMKLL